MLTSEDVRQLKLMALKIYEDRLKAIDLCVTMAKEVNDSQPRQGTSMYSQVTSAISAMNGRGFKISDIMEELDVRISRGRVQAVVFKERHLGRVEKVSGGEGNVPATYKQVVKEITEPEAEEDPGQDGTFEKCDECEGKGYTSELCDTCRGSGEGPADETRCPNCKGPGEGMVPCSKCGGIGDIQVDDTETKGNTNGESMECENEK